MATKDDIAAIHKTLDQHTKMLADQTQILAEHTRDLAIIKHRRGH